MAGSRKGKKKKKGKSNARMSENKQHGSSSFNTNPGQEQSDKGADGSEESGNESPLATTPSCYDEKELEQMLHEKVQQLYRRAIDKLVELGYTIDVIMRALLANGSILGTENVFSNVVSNSIHIIKRGRATTGKPIFSNITQLVKFASEMLINLALRDRPNMKRAELIMFLLESRTLAVPGSPPDRSHPEVYEDSSDKSATEIDLTMLNEFKAYLERLSINATRSSLERNVPSSDTYSQHSMRDEASYNSYGPDNLAFLKSLTNCPAEVSFEDWLRTCSEDSKDKVILALSEQVEKFRLQAKQSEEWAEKTIIQTAKRFNKERIEFRHLKLDKNEIQGLIKQKENLEGYELRVKEKENNLQRAKRELDVVTQVTKGLEAQNQEIQAEVASHNLNASEYEKAVLLARKRERKHLKKSNETEKQIAELRRQIEEEKQNIKEMEERLNNFNEAEKQVELRLRQEKEVKEQAHALLLEEKRLNRVEMKNSESRLASVQHELEMNYRSQTNYIRRLEQELSQLKAQEPSNNASSSSNTESLPEDPHQRFRQCIICRKNDTIILFLPCAHQLICSDCNDEVFEVLENQCPCCKSRIEKRVKVYGPSP